jgi:hypothetical protein
VDDTGALFKVTAGSAADAELRSFVYAGRYLSFDLAAGCSGVLLRRAAELTVFGRPSYTITGGVKSEIRLQLRSPRL